MKAYVVRAGDYLTRIAFRAGMKVADIWDHPKNADLKKLRKSPDILHPGDLLFIPDVPASAKDVTVGETHTFQAVVPTVDVELAVTQTDADAPGKNVLAGMAYRVLGGPEELTGTVPSDGLIKLKVPVTVAVVRLVIEEAGVEYPVVVGGMDPESERSGWGKRLANLGFLDDHEVDETFDLAPSLRAFQRAHNLPQTGEADDATRKALEDKHGS